MTETNTLADRIAAVLRDHSRTTGMAVSMGWTCRCDYWATGKNGETAADHQAVEIAKLFQSEYRDRDGHYWRQLSDEPRFWWAPQHPIPLTLDELHEQRGPLTGVLR